MCLANIALLRGNLGEPGGGVNPLRGRNNVQGSSHIGCEPGSLTAYVLLDARRDLHERVWGAVLSPTLGQNLMQMLDAAAAGNPKALWVLSQRVRLRSRYREAELPIRLSEAIRPAELFCTFHMPEIFVNRATRSHRDRMLSTPESQVTAVQLIP